MQGLALDDAEPDFHEVQPGRRGRGEVHPEPGVAGEPRLHLGGLVHRVVVHIEDESGASTPGGLTLKARLLIRGPINGAVGRSKLESRFTTRGWWTVLRTKRLPGGTTQTVESFWNSTATAFFRGPAGAKINVKYGKGRFSVNRQKQTLDGVTVKKLVVSKGSLVLARMRVKVPVDAEVTYDFHPGKVAQQSREYEF